MKLTAYTDTGRKSSVTVSDQVFSAQPNDQLLAQAVRVYRSNLRQGSSHVKTRSEVKRTKRKWYKQKGTGNARHGARSAHIFIGGGVAHGPRPDQNWKLKLSKNQKNKSLTLALSAQTPHTSLVSLSSIKGKTKQATQLLSSISAQGRILLIIHQASPEVFRSFENIADVLLTKASKVNVLEIASADTILIQKEALKTLEERIIKTEIEVKKTIKKATKKVAEKKKIVKSPKGRSLQFGGQALSERKAVRKTSKKKK